MPAASRSALATIWGSVRVSVKVKVDSAGNTTGVELATRGPSAYFARLSQQAAQEWKFDRSQAGRSFLLHFEFRNSGIKAYATRAGA
jgi:outer membrane biosynthesis protein TonB